MRKILFIVHETDAWHTIASRSLVGVFSSKKRAINAILNNNQIPLSEIFDLQNEKVTKSLIREARREIRIQLEQYSQTMGYQTNYDIEEISVNEWL